MGSFLKTVYFRFAYHLWVKRKMNRTDTIKLLGFKLTIPPGVFHPQLYLSSKFFARYIQTLDLKNELVLDVGCGSGILSLVAASKGAKVTSIDINEQAVFATRENATQNHLELAIISIQSNLFESLDPAKRFNIIFVNPPFYKKKPSSVEDQAWNAGSHYDYFIKFGTQAPKHLIHGGKIYMILSTEGNQEEILSILHESGLSSTKILSKKVMFEKFSIYVLQVK